MARYDYKCDTCGAVFEVEHPMSERPEVTCPECGGSAERVFSASGIVFEGHGFYNTDQRDAGKVPAKGSKSDKKAEGKPAESAKPAQKEN